MLWTVRQIKTYRTSSFPPRRVTASKVCASGSGSSGKLILPLVEDKRENYYKASLKNSVTSFRVKLTIKKENFADFSVFTGKRGLHAEKTTRCNVELPTQPINSSKVLQ